MTARELEIAATRAHARGDDWATFWQSHAADVAALELDYYARGQFVHRLVALVASGDADGQRAAGDSAPLLQDERPAYPQSDDSTVARLLPERAP